MSLSLSGWDRPQPPEPWLYPYQEDGPPRLDLVVQRPVVPVAVVGQDVAAPVYALVDTGCSHVLAAPWIAPDAGEEVFVEWQAEVGFIREWKPTWPMILGQIGFLDQFTVTASLFARHTAVADKGEFDTRFGVPLARP